MKNSKIVLMILTFSVMISALIANCFATTPAALTLAVTNVKTDVMDGLTAVAPIAILVMAAFLVWRYGIKFFKSLAK